MSPVKLTTQEEMCFPVKFVKFLGTPLKTPTIPWNVCTRIICYFQIVDFVIISYHRHLRIFVGKVDDGFFMAVKFIHYWHHFQKKKRKLKKYQVSTCLPHVPGWYICPGQNNRWIDTLYKKMVLWKVFPSLPSPLVEFKSKKLPPINFLPENFQPTKFSPGIFPSFH